jgi:aspartyl-tRNA(Asn)/glutamyl-tRNA(Gln) amidotransferase subunit A
MNAIAGFDPKDLGSLDAPVPDYAKGLCLNIEGLRVGLPTHFFFEGLDAEYAAAVQQAIQLLEGAGARLHDISFPSIEHAQTARSLIILAESASVHQELIRTQASMLGPNVRTRLEVGSTLFASDYLKAQRVRSAFQGEYASAMKDIDVIVTPTSPTPPPRFDEAPILWSADPQVDRKAADRFRWPFNLVGAPAISVPCGFTSSGLPIGLQIAANPLEDELVLKVAYAYEQRTEWQKRRPPVG